MARALELLGLWENGPARFETVSSGCSRVCLLPSSQSMTHRRLTEDTPSGSVVTSSEQTSVSSIIFRGYLTCRYPSSMLMPAWQCFRGWREQCNMFGFACFAFLPAGTSGPQADHSFALSEPVYTKAVIFLMYIHSTAMLLCCHSAICVGWKWRQGSQCEATYPTLGRGCTHGNVHPLGLGKLERLQVCVECERTAQQSLKSPCA